ncbi:MAG TPA: DUF6265 family protein [Cyclobacteriaceae bacterium]|nr:DUF6265 family protein [Cyclobacteriaceae bacterium]
MRLFLILFIAATTAYGQNTTNDLKKLDWLNGTWTRTNPKAGRSGYETWKATSSTTMTGKGIMMKGADTTFIEKIRIELKDGQIFYVADVPENKGEVWFAFTELTANGFVCENPKHDFPKKISYEVDGKNLKATISGDGKAIDYLFVKQ